MTEEQYSALHDKLSTFSNPWKHPELYRQPGEKRSQWRIWVKLMQKAFKEVEAEEPHPCALPRPEESW